MVKMIKANRIKIRQNDILVKTYKDRIYDAVKYIDHPTSLQLKMTDIYDQYASDRAGPPPDANQDINKEYENQ